MVFSYGGDLVAGFSQGGTASRITTDPGLEFFPKFSPDGKWIAFTGQYDGNFNVYVMPERGRPTETTDLRAGYRGGARAHGSEQPGHHLAAGQPQDCLPLAARHFQRLVRAALHCER